MPIYTFECPNCKTELEILQKLGEDIPSCEICGTKLKRTISLGTFILKNTGCGWAKHGYSKLKKSKDI